MRQRLKDCDYVGQRPAAWLEVAGKGAEVDNSGHMD